MARPDRSSTRTDQLVSRRTAAWIVALLCALTLALRLTGLDHGLPHTAHADERYYARQLELLDGGGADLGDDPMARRYPTLVTRVVALLPSAGAPPAGAALSRHTAEASRSLLTLRAAIAILSLLIVPATYLLARRFLARGPALFAAALAALCVLDQWYAQEARPHAAAAGFDAAGLLAALALRRSPTLARHAVAGLALGLALAILPSALALLPALLVAHGLRERRGARSRWPGPLLLLLVAAACVLAFYPAQRAVSPPPLDGGPEDDAWRFLGHSVFLDRFDGSGFATLLAKCWEFDPWIPLLVAVAIVRAALSCARARALSTALPDRSRRQEAAVVAAFALPYSLVIGLYAESFERFLLPLLPCAATVAAWGVLQPAAWSVRAHRTVAALVGSILLAQAASAFQLARLRARPDTLGEAAAWLEVHADRAGTRARTLPFLDLPLVRTPAALRADEHMITSMTHPWMGYLAEIEPAELERLGWDLASADLRSTQIRRSAREQPAEWIAGLEADLLLCAAGTGSRNELLVLLRGALRERATLLARITPRVSEDPSVVERDFPFEEDPRWLPWSWGQFRLRALGPAIEVWSLRR